MFEYNKNLILDTVSHNISMVIEIEMQALTVASCWLNWHKKKM